MNIPKIKFLGIWFLRIALKSKHSWLGVVLQNRQEIDLLIPEQRGTWAILNETCCFWVNTSSQVKSHSPQEKHSDSTGSQRTSWRVFRVATISLWGILFLVRGIWGWLLSLLIPVIAILMLLMIALCIAVHGVVKSRTRLSGFTFTFHFHALEKEMATHSSVLAWGIPGMGEPGGLPSMGLHRVGHDWSDLAAAAAAARRAICLTHFVSAQVNKLQHAVPVQQGYIKLHLTKENITHP